MCICLFAMLKGVWNARNKEFRKHCVRDYFFDTQPHKNFVKFKHEPFSKSSFICAFISPSTFTRFPFTHLHDINCRLLFQATAMNTLLLQTLKCIFGFVEKKARRREIARKLFTLIPSLPYNAALLWYACTSFEAALAPPVAVNPFGTSRWNQCFIEVYYVQCETVQSALFTLAWLVCKDDRKSLNCSKLSKLLMRGFWVAAGWRE